MWRHPETAICVTCVRRLAGQSSRAIPVLATQDVLASVAFWRTAGFEVELLGDEFAIAQGHGVELHIALAAQREGAGGGCYLQLKAVDAIHDRWRTAGLPVSEVRDEPWGMREFGIVDPGGNCVRVGHNV